MVRIRFRGQGMKYEEYQPEKQYRIEIPSEELQRIIYDGARKQYEHLPPFPGAKLSIMKNMFGCPIAVLEWEVKE